MNKIEINIKKYFIAALCLFLFVNSSRSQSFFDSVTEGRKSKKKRNSTKIDSKKLNINMLENLVIFSGEVFVDDDDMTIKCDKMTIHLQNKEKKGLSEKKDDENLQEQASGGKEVEKIVCIGNVEIIRKIQKKQNKKPEVQKSESGEAVYYIKTGKIELTDKPIIYKGQDKLEAEKIILYRDSEQMEAINPKIRIKNLGAVTEDKDEETQINSENDNENK